MRIPPRQYYAARRLARLISIPFAYICFVLEHGVDKFYQEWSIPKRGGGERNICAPIEPLMAIQSAIGKVILNRLPVSPIAHGYVHRRSIATNAMAHAFSRSILSLDLADAFGSTGMSEHLCLAGWNQQKRSDYMFGVDFAVLELIAVLCERHRECGRVPIVARRIDPELPDELVFYEGYLPQGAPTSPALFNFACRAMDERLLRLATNVGGVVTRYSDNIAFSMPDDEISPALQNAVVRIIDRSCFEINWRKKRYISHGNTEGQPLRVPGINIIDSDLYLRPGDIRRLRMKLYCAGKTGDSDTYLGVRGHAIQVYAAMPPQLKGVFRKARDSLV